MSHLSWKWLASQVTFKISDPGHPKVACIGLPHGQDIIQHIVHVFFFSKRLDHVRSIRVEGFFCNWKEFATADEVFDLERHDFFGRIRIALSICLPFDILLCFLCCLEKGCGPNQQSARSKLQVSLHAANSNWFAAESWIHVPHVHSSHPTWKSHLFSGALGGWGPVGTSGAQWGAMAKGSQLNVWSWKTNEDLVQAWPREQQGSLFKIKWWISLSLSLSPSIYIYG